MKKKLLTALSIVGCGLVMFNAFNTAESRSRTQVPTGVSGGPGDIKVVNGVNVPNTTCSNGSCHHDFAGASTSSLYSYQYSVPKTGWITSNVPVGGYVPGATYDITISINSPGYQYGFQASCQTAAGLFKGTLIENDSSFVSRSLTGTVAKEWISEMDSVDAIAHVPSISAKIGYRGTVYNPNGKSWTFKWIAPAAGTGAVSIYSAMVTANGNGSDNGMLPAGTTGLSTILGDSVFTSVLPLTENTTLGSIAITNACTAGTGSATMNASYGTPPYTYVWSPGGAITQTISNLAAGNYTCTVTDAAGVPVVQTFTGTVVPSISITTTQAIPTCIGNTATMTATATGGVGATYTYAWAPTGGATSPSAAVVPNATYTVTVSNSGCSNTAVLKKLDQGALDVFWRPWANTNPTCIGGNNGTLKVQRAAGFNAYTYVWKNSLGAVIPYNSAQTLDSLAAGTYSCVVTATGTGTCSTYTDTKTASFTLVNPSSNFTPAITKTDITCFGASNGTATAAPTGLTTNYTFLWSPGGQTTAAITGLAAGTYTCVMTAIGTPSCTGTASVTIAEPSAPGFTASITAPTMVLCKGASTGAATVVPVGNIATTTYIWSPVYPGYNTATTTALKAGTYSVTVTDPTGCRVVTTTITEPTLALTVTVPTSTMVLCKGAATGAATALAAGGTGTATYSWNSTPVQPTAAATNLLAGTYTVTVTDANSCTATATKIITEPGTALSVTVPTSTMVLCKGAATGAATALAAGGTGTATYSWNTTPVQITAAATNLLAGTYTVTATDANNCTAATTSTITEPLTAITASIGTPTMVLCRGAATGAATVTATGGTAGTGFPTYSWSTTPVQTTATASGLIAGTYTVTVTDANNCSAAANVTITQPNALSGAWTTSIPASCFGGTNGKATIVASGGTSPYTYAWTPSGGTGATTTSLAAGTYTCTITDACAATTTVTAMIAQPAAIAATITSSANVLCNGGNNGYAIVTPTGGTGAYTYTWAPTGGTGGMANNLTAATYTVTVKDANNCTKTATASITQPTALAATIASQTNVLCKGAHTGSVTISAIGGTGSKTYSWAPTGGTSATATNLGAGIYTVTIMDANSCIVTKSVTITEPAAIVGIMSSNPDNGTGNGAAFVSVTGGNAPYQYSWSPTGGSSLLASPLSAGSYYVTVTDANGCTYTNSVFVNSTAASAAITITAADYTNLPASNFQNTDTLPVAAITPGNSGANVVWDFTGLHPYLNVANNLITPSTGVLYSSFPTPNMCLNQGNTDYSYFEKQPSALTFLGNAGDLLQNGTPYEALVLSNPATVITYPSTYGTAFNDVSAYDSKYAYNGTMSGIQVDSVREKETTTITSIMDGFGTVKTPTYPSGYPCIRQNVTKVSVDSTWAKIVNPVSGLHYWINTNGSTSTTRSYTYITNVIGGPVVDIQMKANTTGNTNADISEVKWNPAVFLTVTASSTPDNGTANGTATATATGTTGTVTYLWSPGGQTTATATALATGDYAVTVTDAVRTVTTTVFVNTTAVTNAITFTSANYSGNLTVGASYTQNTDTMPVVAIKPGNSGANVTWDFTALVPNSTATNTSIDPTTGVLYNKYTTPVPNACLKENGTNYIYFDNSTTKLDMLGTAGDLLQNSTNNALVLSNPETVITFPSTYGTAFTDVSAYDNRFAFNATYSGIQVDSVREKEKMTITSLIDGFGTVITPTSGAQGYPCLRQKVTKVSVDSSWAKIVNPLSGLHYWMNVSAKTSTSISYSYISDAISGTVVVDIQLKADSTGNSNTAISEVKWNPAAVLAATVSMSTNVLCFGDNTGSATVTATGGSNPYSYSWAPTGGTAATATGLGAGTYTVTVTDASNISATATVIITEPATALTAITSSTPQSVPGNGTATVTASGGTGTYTYLWSPSGQTTATATGLNGGTYTVVVTDANGCTTTQTIIVENTVGIANQTNSGIAVYPNPASDYLTINQVANDNLNVVIFDLTGREVLNSTINGPSNKISVTSLANGTYILKMFSKGEIIITNNLVINH